MSRLRRYRYIWITLFLLIALFAIKKPVEQWVRAYVHDRTPRETVSVSSVHPDQIALTWHDDPSTSQAIQWRTSPETNHGAVEYRPLEGDEAESQILHADPVLISDPIVVNDPYNHRFNIVLEGLRPATAYTYRVGTPQEEIWSDWFQFETAPSTGAETNFSFLYLGDIQEGFEYWGELQAASLEAHPEARFCLIAGDLVNRGNDRDEWDALFYYANHYFAERPLVPALGNHEYPRGDEPQFYHDLLLLPENGPDNIPKERAFHITYGNALFVILDSNLSIEDQTEWLEESLAASDATWKFVMYHHPAYSSRQARDNPKIREYWTPLFDAYGVDVVFQGHDHAYMRTHPLRAHEIVDEGAEGVIYVISNAGTKYYNQDPNPFMAVGFENAPTYQVIDIEVGETDRLRYRAYDLEGTLLDEFELIK